MTHTRLVALLLTSALVVPSAMSAQEVDLGTLRISSAQAQALLGNDEITEEEIAERNASTTKDVFAGESSVTASGGAAIAQKVFVNGIEESLLSVTIDGARQNKSAFHHTGNVLLDPELLKRVEISEGLAPADAGPSALAGAIAYETKSAGDLLEDGKTYGGFVKMGLTDNKSGFGTTIALYGMQGSFEYLISGTRRKSDSYEDGSGTVVTGTGADLTNYVGKFAYTSDAGHRLEFAASDTEDTGLRAAQRGPGGLLFIRPDFFGLRGGPSVLVEGLSKRTSYTLTYTTERPEGIWDPTIQLSYNEQAIDAVAVYGTNKSFSGTFKNDFQIGNGVVSAGLDFFNESARGQGQGPGPLGSSGLEKLRNVGVFAQARQDLGSRVSVSYGFRYDWQNFTGADGSKIKESGLSANATIDYELTNALTLNAGLASNWGGFELGEAAIINFGSPWTYAGMKPARSNAARIGLRYEEGPWNASVALFKTDINNLNTVLPDARNGITRGTTGDLESKGVELGLQYNWASGFARMNWTYADVQLNGATVGTTAYYVGRPVGHIIALESGWDITDEWRVGGNAEIALKNNKTTTPLPSYKVVNVFASYKPRNMKNFELRADIRNLFDETYASRSSDGLDFPRVIPLNEPGRTIGITASFKF